MSAVIYMNFKNNLLIKGLLLNFMTVPALADATNGTSALMPNLNSGWAGLPPDVQKWVTWIISVAFALFVAVAIIYTFGGSIKAIIGGQRGDVAGRSSGISEAFMGVGIVIIAIIAILLILYVASSV